MRKYHYMISEQCNMKCTYCNVNVDNLTKLSNKQFDNFYLTIPQDEYIFDIFGGEPFLQMKEVQYIINILEKDSNCKRINITTNGTVMNNSIKKLSKCSKLYITLSYDGLSQVSNRGNQTIHIHDFINMGVTHSHSMLIGEMFDEKMVNNYLIDNHKDIEAHGLVPDLTLVRDVGTWNDLQSKNFLKQFKDYIKFIIPKINNDEYNFKTLPGLIRIYLNAIFEYSIKNNSKTDCRCGEVYTSILPSGEILPCERFKRNDEVYTIFKNKELKDSIMSECNTCEIRDVCHKGCIYEQLLNNGVIPELCTIYKGIVKELKILLQETNHKLIKQFIKENGYAKNTK